MTVDWSNPKMGSNLNVDEIEDLLNLYESNLVSIKAALTDLELSPSYLMLTDASVSGETTRIYGEVAKKAQDLWPLTDAAAYQLEGARNFFNDTGGKGKDRLEMIRFLKEPWHDITTPHQGGTRRYSIEQTFTEISKLYEAVMVGVEKIDVLWSSIMPRIKAAQQAMQTLETQTKKLGVTEPLVGRTQSLALDLANRLTSDPLSVKAADGPALDRDVAEATRQVASLQAGHDTLNTDLGNAAELVDNVRGLRLRAEAARNKTLEKIRNPTGVIKVPSAHVVDGVNGLAQRLEVVAGLETGSDWSQRRSVLDAWLTTARQLHDQLKKAERSNRAPVETRDELRGRLHAYRAKAAGIGKAEDLELMESFEQARIVLYTSPTDLGLAEELLTNLAARLKK